MYLVQSCQVSVAVGGSIWVEKPHVKEGLLTSAPETVRSDVQSCFILPVGSTWSDALTIQSLQHGFHSDIVAHFPQQFSRQVTDLIMTWGRFKSSAGVYISYTRRFSGYG